ncbi:MAG: GNAT family N-acetyltransferase [Thermogutta sp.]
MKSVELFSSHGAAITQDRTMSYVVEIRALDQLVGYQLAWRKLWTETPAASFFQSYEWFETYWRHFGDNQILRVLAVYSDGEIIGLLPLVVRTETTRLGPVRVLTYPLDEWGSFFGPVGKNPTATLLAGLRHVRESHRDWDILDLRWVDKEGLDRTRTPTVMRQVGLHPQEQPWMPSAIVKMEESWESYWASRTSKFRNNVRRAEKRLSAWRRVEFLRYRPRGGFTDDDPRWDLYEICHELSLRGWQARDTKGKTLAHADVADFLRDVHHRAAHLGCMEMNILAVDGQPIAFAYNYVCDGRVFGLRTAYDPAWAEANPGTYLRYRMIRDSFERGDSEFNLGPGYLESKKSWANHLTYSYRYTYFPSSPRAQLLRLKRWWDYRFGRNRPVAKTRPA